MEQDHATVEWLTIRKLNWPPFSVTSILSTPGGGTISKSLTSFPTMRESRGNASMIPGQLRRPTPKGRNLKSTLPPTSASTSFSSSKNLSGRNSSGLCHHSGLFPSHHAFTITLALLGMSYPPSLASSRFMWGTRRGMGECSRSVSLATACRYGSLCRLVSVRGSSPSTSHSSFLSLCWALG
ncbi:hypothetical protein MUK42_00131 [Musa troglodytarum]|uniref:Uncharacterized protein n=1 Tax=Musa troglodytarum TaxID=320322 RepID=A0A9E7FAA4_9LILI|nr:hypothetical protein MUK42_00131 [Musa troglodytarum]